MKVYEFTILVEYPGGKGEYHPATGELKLSTPVSDAQRELIRRRCELMVESRKRVDRRATYCTGLIILAVLGGFAAIVYNLLN